MEYGWLLRFSACGRTTKSAGFWASYPPKYEQGLCRGAKKHPNSLLSTWVAVEYEYLGREAYLEKISPIGKIFLETSRNHAIFIPIGKKL